MTCATVGFHSTSIRKLTGQILSFFNSHTTTKTRFLTAFTALTMAFMNIFRLEQLLIMNTEICSPLSSEHQRRPTYPGILFLGNLIGGKSSSLQ